MKEEKLKRITLLFKEYSEKPKERTSTSFEFVYCCHRIFQRITLNRLRLAFESLFATMFSDKLPLMEDLISYHKILAEEHVT